MDCRATSNPPRSMFVDLLEKIRKLIADYKPSRQVQTNVETRIVLKDQEPICAKPRRLSVQEKQVLQKQVDEWLKDGIVRLISSAYSNGRCYSDKERWISSRLR